ncbi:MAG: SgcJ/EcaC family oxidoreductase [Planctomycetaceae bacterium]|nr:SgcJ/EcaC family oxidoreductase [Planctomycetaceae bacterium]
MIRAFLIAQTLVMAALGYAPLTAQETSPVKPILRGAEVDWTAIAASAERFTEAFNAADATAVAETFTPHGEYVDVDRNLFQGRDAIQAEFSAFFAENPKATIEIDVQALRFLAPNLAVEEGVTFTELEGTEHTARTRYTAVHIKQDNQWRVARVRDFNDEFSNAEGKLRSLSWMVGEWVDESQDAMIETKVYWDEGGRYLIRDYHVLIDGSKAMKGQQRIGWDPLTRRIHSWVFDSAGGRMEGLWTQVDDGWLVKSKGVTADGKLATATHILTPVTQDSFRWVSLDRVAGEEKLPDLAMTIVRRPPNPKSALQQPISATAEEGGQQ